MRRTGDPAVLLALAVAALAVALLVKVTGGLDTEVAGIPLRSRSWERPATVAAVLALVAAARSWRQVAAAVPVAWRAAVRVARGVIAALPVAAACWAAAASLAFGTYAAGGSDSYGYVSQAELLARGDLTDRIRRHRGFTWPDVPRTLTPLGYTRGTTRDALAPVYPPGLPLLMAPFAALHRHAVFFVVPICAVAAVLLCWGLGRQLGEPDAGRMAALLLATSPTFVHQAVQPMSDVPVTAFWLGALFLARREGVTAAALSGVTASIAVLIRPNLAPLALLVAVAAATAGPRVDLRRAGACAAALIPGIALLAFVQHVRHGSPLASGYGPFGDLFSLANIRPNLARYPRWLTETHTPFIWAWVAAPLLALPTSGPARSLTGVLYAFAAAVLAAYLPYVYFQPQEWFYTRFLLPALPVMLLLGSAVVIRLLRRIVGRHAVSVTFALVLILGAVYAMRARSLGAFELRQAERKYAAAGALARDLPESAMVFAMQHSGSIRYYSGRDTVRWDLLDREWLDRAIAQMRAAGREPYALLDGGEVEQFRTRFEAAGQMAVDRMIPIGEVEGTRLFGFP
jgi:hypothetical protein